MTRAIPERLKKYLGQTAPPLLYGVGSKELLNRGGLVVVGSRNRSEEDGEFARRIGEHCAQEGIAIISGAAKGIDREAMSGALESGGWALGVLAEGLARTATSGQYRSGLVSDHLTLVSPYDPDSRWFAYAAMDRNKLLYGLGDAALVVASSAETGGTWAGATEALQHGRVKVFVKSTGGMAPGNPKLLRMGGVPFPAEPWQNIRALFTRRSKGMGNCFLRTPGSPRQGKSAQTQRPVSQPHPRFRGDKCGHNGSGVPRFGQTSEETPPLATAEQSCSDAYSLVIEQMLILLKEPRTTNGSRISCEYVPRRSRIGWPGASAKAASRS